MRTAKHGGRTFTNSELFIRNRQAAVARNNGIMNISLLSALLVFTMALVSTFFFADLAYMRPFCLLILGVCALIWLILRRLKQRLGIVFIYLVYGILIAYSIVTSAFVSPNYICVTILAFLFQFPVLYLDKGWRIDLATLLSAAVYLLVVCPHKSPALVTDELINVVAFAVLGCVVGAFTRRTQLENYEMKQTLETFAYTDTLSSLANRRRFFELLTEAEQPDFRQPILSLAMIDIDDFKTYNDTYGHQSGDECLRRIGACFRQYQQEHGLAFFRYGGEEFVAVDRSHTPERFFELCELLRQSVEQLRIENTDGSFSAVTLSIGAASMDDPASRKYEALLSRADKALYAAKTGGKNRLLRYDDLADPDSIREPASFRQRR